jgi:ATP-dependent Clp protease ATP-binding subunit ClpA
MGVVVESLKAAVDQELSRLPVVTGGDQLYLTPALDESITAAENQAAAMHDDYVSVEHLFLALLETARGGVKELFETYRIVKENALRTYATIPDVMTTVELGGDNDTALSEEGIAFSPVYHLALRKTIQKGDVNTWLKLQKAN